MPKIPSNCVYQIHFRSIVMVDTELIYTNLFIIKALKYYQMLNGTIRFEVFDFINDGGYTGSSRL